MMSKYILGAAAALLLTSGAFAQTETQPQTPSTVDQGAAQKPGGDKTAPKTTGAMNNAADSVATSPQDVKSQQEGKGTAAEGGEPRPGAPQHDITKDAPKTTGAAPGSQ
jgi:hypothetical protein